MRGSVKGRTLRIVHVRRDGTSYAKEEIVFDPVGRNAETQICCSHRFAQVSNHIAMRPHLGSGPIAEPAVVHRKSIMVLCHGRHTQRQLS